MATEIEPLIMPFDPLWVTTSKREYREAVRRMGELPMHEQRDVLPRLRREGRQEWLEA